MTSGGPETAAVGRVEKIRESPAARTIRRDPGSGLTIQSTRLDLDANGRPGLERIESIDLVTGHGIHEQFSINDDDPLSASAEIFQCAVSRRGDWATEVRTRIRFTATPTQFRLEAELRVFDRDQPFFERHWDELLERDLV